MATEMLYNILKTISYVRRVHVFEIVPSLHALMFPDEEVRTPAGCLSAIYQNSNVFEDAHIIEVVNKLLLFLVSLVCCHSKF